MFACLSPPAAAAAAARALAVVFNSEKLSIPVPAAVPCARRSVLELVVLTHVHVYAMCTAADMIMIDIMTSTSGRRRGSAGARSISDGYHENPIMINCKCTCL